MVKGKKFFCLFIVAAFCLSANLFAAENTDTLNIITWNVQQGTYYNSETTPAAVAEVILENKIDFFGCQEQDVTGAKRIAALLDDYGWYGVGREDGESEGETCAMFYNKTKFMMADSGTFWLSETPNIVGSKSWDSQDVRIVSWCKFIRISDSKVIYMFNNHFDHVSSEAREQGAILLRKKVNEIAGKNAAFITGDFNCGSSSTAYANLTASYDDYLDVYDSRSISETDPEGPSGTYNAYTSDSPTSRIDFIFLNPYFDVKTYAVLTDKYEDDSSISDHFPVKIKVALTFPTAPETPTLSATAGNGQVTLSWDNVAETETVEAFTDSSNDFEGYKLYKSKTPDMSDALLVADSWDVPLLRDPLMECDLEDDIYGYTNYGIVDGFGYYLGNDSGLQHYYIDNDVENGQVYYYVLLAYDYGISDMADGFAPMETDFTLDVDGNGNVTEISKNVAVVTPESTLHNSSDYVTFDSSYTVMGTGDVSVVVADPAEISDKTYRLTFNVDTLDMNSQSNSKYRSEHDVYFVNSGFNIYSVDDDSLVYSEDTTSFTGQNVLLNNTYGYYYLNTEEDVVSEKVDGFQLDLSELTEVGGMSSVNSGWETGASDITITESEESFYFPWNFDIEFGESYTGVTSKTKWVRDADNNSIASANLLLEQSYNLKAVSTDFEDETLDIVTYDVNGNGKFDYATDQLLIGYSTIVGTAGYWCGTVCALTFNDSTALPNDGDVYKVRFNRPFTDSDTLMFSITTNPTTGIEEDEDLPTEFSLAQNYPNPFNPTTKIEYTVSNSGNYKLVIFNILGERVATLVDGYKAAGKYTVDFNAGSFSSGVYIYSLQGDGQRITKKMMLLK